MKQFKFIIVTCLVAPIGFLPLSWSQALGARLGKLLLRFNHKRRHIAQCNIDACFPALSDHDKKILLQKNAEETGKWFLETPYVWFRKPNYIRKQLTITNGHILQEAYVKGRGVILILPHLGNWEVLNFYVPFHYPTAAMYQSIKSPALEEMVFRSRSRTGITLFSANQHGVRKALKHLKQGKILVVLSDHLPSKKAGVYAPFFDIPAWTGKLTHSLVNYNQSTVVLGRTLRKTDDQGFEVGFTVVSGMDTDDPVQALTAMNQAIEAEIRKTPEQYQWVYRRFARPPEGGRNIYR